MVEDHMNLKRMAKRLMRIRGYRNKLMNECNTRVDSFLATPDDKLTPTDLQKQNDYMRVVQLRMRLMNKEIDRIVDGDPRVLCSA
jgi:hypothetical protein